MDKYLSEKSVNYTKIFSQRIEVEMGKILSDDMSQPMKINIVEDIGILFQ